MSAAWRVSEVKVIADHAVSVCFEDGLEGVVRFLPGSFRGVFAHLIDSAQFRFVSVVGGAVTWPGEHDLAPDSMHEEIKLRSEWIVDK